MKHTMQKVQFEKIGDPDVLQIVNAPIPEPLADELLIKVSAAGINPIDGKIRKGTSFVNQRPDMKLPLSLGLDVSGTVTKVGENVTDFKIADSIFGYMDLSQGMMGAYAEYCVIKAKDVIKRSNKLSHSQAAALPIAGLTAWQVLFDVGQLKAGEKVVINAAAGGVGHLAVQLAKNSGAEVYAVASKSHHEFLKDLGIENIIDYQQSPVAQQISDIDLVIDSLGGDLGVTYFDVLNKNGRLVTLPTVTLEQIQEQAKQKNINAQGVLAKMNKEQLEKMQQMIIDKELKIAITGEFSLNDVVQAHRQLADRHNRGKLVLTNVNAD